VTDQHAAPALAGAVSPIGYGDAMGRPRIGTTVQIVLPDDLLARLRVKASLEGVNLSELIRHILWASTSE
jgi:hypothetical protein